MQAKRSVQECHGIMTRTAGSLYEIETKQIKGQTYRVYKNIPDSIRDFWVRAVHLYAERTYLIYESESYTYQDINRLALKCVSHLEHIQCRKGDRIALIMRNYPEWIVCFWASALMGCILCPINAWLKARELKHCIENSGATIVFLDKERAEVLKDDLPAVKARCQALKSIVQVRGAQNTSPDLISWNEAVLAWPDRLQVPRVAIDPEDDCTVFYTSGTTALPKGVLSTNRQFMTNLANGSIAKARALLRNGEDLPHLGSSQTGVCLLISIPLFHVTGCQSFMLTATLRGAKIVLVYKWDAKAAAKLIVDQAVTFVGGVPSMARELAALHSARYADLSSIDTVSYGGAPASEHLPSELAESFPRATAGQAYGLTETNAVAISHAGIDYLQHPTSAGFVSPVNEIKILDTETGQILPEGRTGELYVRGPNVASGYWRNPEATAEAFLKDGWFKTGDLASADKDNYVYIRGRSKDMIIRGGENISALQVETVIGADRRVMDVAVVAVKHEQLGEEVAAVVSVKEGCVMTHEDIVQISMKELPKYMVPVFSWIRREAIPKTGNGKISKKELRPRVEEMWEREKTRRACAQAKL